MIKQNIINNLVTNCLQLILPHISVRFTTLSLCFQNDASSRRHLLSATDLFLDSARQQIGLLINDTKPLNVNENGESD